MKKVVGALLALSMVLLSFSAHPIARSQSGITVRNNSAESAFPSGITFSLDATASSPFDDIRLSYRVAPDGVSVTAAPQCTSGLPTHCTFTFANTQASPLVPGGLVTYFWRLVAGAATQDTPEQNITYEDTRFDWKTITDGNVTIWYYSSSESNARAVLEAGRASIDRMSALLNTTVDFPVKIFYYASAQDMQPAIIAQNPEGAITAGEVFYSDTAMVSAEAESQEVARHEIAHIVIRQALKGPYSVPDWLHEGTAVYAQLRPLSSHQQALDSAIAANQVFSVRSLSSTSVGITSDKIFLFYGESGSLVKFIVETYGQEKFAQLFQVFKAGATTAQALETVYGFDQDGLENAWRKSVGLPPREPVTVQQSAQSTTPSAPAATAATGKDSGGNIAVAILIAALTVVLAGGLVVVGVLLARRYR